jgi:hypothetical protein
LIFLGSAGAWARRERSEAGERGVETAGRDRKAATEGARVKAARVAMSKDAWGGHGVVGEARVGCESRAAP